MTQTAPYRDMLVEEDVRILARWAERSGLPASLFDAAFSPVGSRFRHEPPKRKRNPKREAQKAQRQARKITRKSS